MENPDLSGLPYNISTFLIFSFFFSQEGKLDNLAWELQKLSGFYFPPVIEYQNYDAHNNP